MQTKFFISFHSYIYGVFKFFNNNIVIDYKDNVLILSFDPSASKTHPEILRYFFKTGLYAKLNWCQFRFNYILFFYSIFMNKSKKMEVNWIVIILIGL